MSRRVRSDIFVPRHSLILKHAGFLKSLFLATKQKNVRRLHRLINNASAEEIQTLCEISRNFLTGRYPSFSKKLVENLRKEKCFLRKIACLKTKAAKRRTLLLQKNQRGGFLALLGTLLLPLLTTVLSRVLK